MVPGQRLSESSPSREEHSGAPGQGGQRTPRSPWPGGVGQGRGRGLALGHWPGQAPAGDRELGTRA